MVTLFVGSGYYKQKELMLILKELKIAIWEIKVQIKPIEACKQFDIKTILCLDVYGYLILHVLFLRLPYINWIHNSRNM